MQGVTAVIGRVIRKFREQAGDRQQPVMESGRQYHLDAMRGIASLVVILNHFAAVFFPYTVFGARTGGAVHAPWEELFFYPPFGILIAGNCAVNLFFILSGYVLSYKYLGEPGKRAGLVAAAVKRPVRLGGLVWLTMTVGAILWYFGLFANGPVAELTGAAPWLDAFWQGSFDTGRFFKDLLLSPFGSGARYNPPLWTIEKELYGSFMVYLFLFLVGHFRYRRVIAVGMILASYSSLSQGFWIGLLAADIIKHAVRPVRSLPRPLFLMLVLGFVYFASFPHDVDASFLKTTVYGHLPDSVLLGGGYPMLAAVLIFLLVMTDKQWQEFLHKPLFRFLGRLSYGIYTVHFPVIGSWSCWLFLQLQGVLSHGQAVAVVFLTSLPMIALSAWAATVLVDEPAIRLARRIGGHVEKLCDRGREKV
jgi:peptidoglycan/LPS O-acetylase OafA/YrhL